MYAVICTSQFYKVIEQAVTSKGEQIIYKAVDNDIDVIVEFERIGRLAIKHLIIDITAIVDHKILLNAVQRYRITNDNTQIIIIAPNYIPGNELLSSMVSMGIYDIIAPAGDNFDELSILHSIIEVLDNPSPYKRAVKWIVNKSFDNKSDSGGGKDKVKEKIIEVEKTVLKTIKQQVLVFYTTDNNLDKDDVLTQISCLLAKRTDAKHKILVIDMNSTTPTLDHFFGVDKEILLRDTYSVGINTGLSAVYNAIEKKIFSPDLLDDMVIKHKKLNNLFVLTGLYDLRTFELMDIKHYETLINAAKEVYDTIIINTNTHIGLTATYAALKNATDIIMVCNANYTNARNINFILKNLIEFHKFPKDKFKILINNLSKFSLSKDYMNRIFESFKIIGYLPFDSFRETALNKKSTYIFSTHAKKHINAYMEVVENLGYIPKVSIINKYFGGNKIGADICTESLDIEVRD